MFEVSDAGLAHVHSTESPKATPFHQGLDGFVTSAAALIVTGRNDPCRAQLVIHWKPQWFHGTQFFD